MDKKHIVPYVTKKEITEELNSLNLFTPTVKHALNIAEKVHKNQKRDNGKPYLTEHIFSIVKSILSKYEENKKLEEMIITVLLHDVIEDSDCMSLEEINDLFGSKIAENVELLTKPKNKSLKSSRTVEDWLELARIQSILGQKQDAINSLAQAKKLDPVRSDIEKIYFSVSQ